MLIYEGGAQAADPLFYLWPCNLAAWNFFHACGTQWRHGFDGPTGLDYASVEIVMERRRVPRRERDKLWDLLIAMESGALTGWREIAREK